MNPDLHRDALMSIDRVAVDPTATTSEQMARLSSLRDAIDSSIESIAKLRSDDRVPDSIVFFPNGMAATCDKNGNQIGRFNGRHETVKRELKEAGHDYTKFSEVLL